MALQPTHSEHSVDALQSLAAAAHELKTPLAIIRHLASALEDDLLVSPEQRQQSLQRIQLSAERSMRLVQGLITSYKLDGQAGFELNLEPVNIQQICEEAAHEILPFAAITAQDIQIATSPSQVVVGERGLLHTVIFSLLDNAVRHTPPESRVRLALRRKVDMVRVSVSDDGPGLRPSDITQLQKRLGRQLQPIVTRSSGSGLGLYIAQSLVGAMGGTIGVGRPKVGAVFYADLLRSKQLSLWS